MGSILLLVTFGALLSQLIWAVVWAVRAVRYSHHLAPDQRMAMRFIAVHLAEPIINVFVVGILLLAVNQNLEQILFGGEQRNGGAHPVAALLSSTWPMLVLLVPVLGLGSADALVRSLNTRLVILGLARWVVTGAILVYPFALPLGLLLLWYCVAWCRRQILEVGAHSQQAIGFGKEGILVDYAENMEVGQVKVN